MVKFFIHKEGRVDDHPMAFLYDPRDAGESLPTHPYKKRLGHYQKKGLLAPYTPGVLDKAAIKREP